jgi:CRISPR/Cas system-associated endonuclease Cas1
MRLGRLQGGLLVKRSLYLNENFRGISVIRDGPSVLLRENYSAPRRVPVQFINKVFVIGNIRFDSASIELFAENNVPVIFMNRKGEDVAMVIPYNHRLPVHYEEQKLILQSDKNIQQYLKWAMAKRSIIQLKVLKQIFRKKACKFNMEIGEGNYQYLLKRLKPGEDKWATVIGTITNLFRGLITERVLKSGLDPHTGVIHRRHNFGFVLDVCYIISAEIDYQALSFFKSSERDKLIIKSGQRWEITNIGMRNIINRFENKSESLQWLIDEIIDEVFELIRELRT